MTDKEKLAQCTGQATKDDGMIPYHQAYFGCCNRTVMTREDIDQPKFCPFCGRMAAEQSSPLPKPVSSRHDEHGILDATIDALFEDFRAAGNGHPGQKTLACWRRDLHAAAAPPSASPEGLAEAKARLSEATNWHQFGEGHDEDGWCCKRETELRDEVMALEMAAAPSRDLYKCKAQPTADPPQDCDWPVCGCDPYADKVIEALQESGKLPAAPSTDLLGEREASKKAFEEWRKAAKFYLFMGHPHLASNAFEAGWQARSTVAASPDPLLAERITDVPCPENERSATTAGESGIRPAGNTADPLLPELEKLVEKATPEPHEHTPGKYQCLVCFQAHQAEREFKDASVNYVKQLLRQRRADVQR